MANLLSCWCSSWSVLCYYSKVRGLPGQRTSGADLIASNALRKHFLMPKPRVERSTYRGPAKPELGGVSLVFPVRNESFIIEMTLRNYLSELQPRIADFELIVAEDGSTDDTKAVLERLAKELPIRLFISAEPKGYQKAVIDAVS